MSVYVIVDPDHNNAEFMREESETKRFGILVAEDLEDAQELAKYLRGLLPECKTRIERRHLWEIEARLTFDLGKHRFCVWLWTGNARVPVPAEILPDDTLRVIDHRQYVSLPLIGGPKDGHVVRIRLGRDGTVTAPCWRVLKLSRGRQAWYGLDAEAEKYIYRETVSLL